MSEADTDRNEARYNQSSEHHHLCYIRTSTATGHSSSTWSSGVWVVRRHRLLGEFVRHGRVWLLELFTSHCDGINDNGTVFTIRLPVER